jgi:hypothetical protein
MPETGEINKQFGIYTSICCGQEIVIPEGARFPNCPRHPNVTTTWKSDVDESNDVRDKKKPAA